MKKKELYDKVIAYFEQAMPVAETELHYGTPFELLVAVILSAQCTDKRHHPSSLSGFSDTGSDGLYHTGSHIRVYP